jgi:hypothetical protein
MVFRANLFSLPIHRDRERLQVENTGPESEAPLFRRNERLSFFSGRLMPYESPLDVAVKTI